MLRRVDFFFWAGLAVYVIFTRLCCVDFGSNVLFPALLLIGIGAWLYGRTGGLLLSLGLLIYHYTLYDWFYTCGVHWTENETKAIGTILSAFIPFIIGHIKDINSNANSLKESLDLEVKKRTQELNALTSRLISEDEKLRINLAQNIHDGLGQHLTGLLLYSSSLETELRNKKSAETVRAAALTEKAQTNLHLARKTSRTLFPIKMAETGLETALDEMISYFAETTGIKFDIQLNSCHRLLPDQTILQLYRIIYEGILSALYSARPAQIDIRLSGEADSCLLLIEYDGYAKIKSADHNLEVALMNYRAQQINGHLTIADQSGNRTLMKCRIPYKQSCNDDTMDALLYA
jgi:signal transduction histidine kinase